MKPSIREIIDQVQTGHEFGIPWKWAENAGGLLIPILRTSAVTPRAYTMLEEAKDRVSVQDTGNIGIAKLLNQTKETIFVRGGTLLVGKGTQSRAIQTGVLVPSGKQEVPINCVHASHYISSGAQFKIDGYTPRHVTSALRERNQARVWDSVSRYSDELLDRALRRPERDPTYFSMLQEAAPDNLVANLETVKQFKSDVDDAIRRMPRAENQVGAAIFDINGVVGIELFDHPDSWKALSEEVIRQYSDVIEQKMPDYLSIDMDKVVVNIKAFLELAKESRELEERSGTTVLTGKVTGEYTILKDKMIHLLLAREEINNDRHVTFGREPVGQHLRFSPFAPPHHFYCDARREAPTIMLSRSTVGFGMTESEERYFSLVKSKELLDELRKGDKTWSELSNIFGKSVSTQQRIIDEAIALGYVIKEGITKPAYRLAAKGHNALNNAHKLRP